MENYRDELYHYGVKGMRWGVRKRQEYGAIRSNMRAANKAYDAKMRKAVETGKLSRQEARRRSDSNYWINRYDAASKKRQAKSDFYRERAGMQKNSKKAARDLKKAERLAAKSKKYAGYARDEKREANKVNKIYDTKLSKGEKLLVDYGLSHYGRNNYLKARENMSGKEASARLAIDVALSTIGAEAYSKSARN